MKLMIASDIHGSLYYCEKMREAYEREKADKLILLGDLLYHGPRNDLPKGYNPKGVIALLNGMKSEILCVRGNCEAEVDQMVLEFPIMSDSMILYLEGRMVFVTHGHLFNSERLPMLKKGDILLHGHTHVQALKDCGDHLYLNPGSVSIPKEGNQNSYMIYENGCFAIRNLEGGEIGRLAL
ncbi:MAG: phosphodiesterase [Oscillospiraceae bacterium]|nr:phosphodiesterase [Oscillospiraceae bacterium]